MKRTHIFRALLISYLISHISYLSPAAASPILLPAFTFAGRVTDYAHIGYDADMSVEIRAKDEKGNLVAKTKTATGGSTAYNFVLDIPLSSTAVDGCVMSGAKLVFEFVDPDGKIYTGLVTEGDSTVGNPGGLRELKIALATDADGDGIPDEYVDTLGYLMWINEKESYDPNADWDGDGANNRAEYVAGTNPFDPKDRLSVRELAEEKGYEDYLKFSFLANQGRSYSVDTAEDLKNSTWRQTVFVDAEDGAKKSFINTSPTKAAAYRAIYVLKENVKQQFWKLKVE